MDIQEIQEEGYEKVLRAVDAASGLRALIAVHDTTLGPALGGMRMWPYQDEEEALTDVLRLARGMTFKSAVAHTGLGGGKSVVIGDPRRKSRELFLAMGRFVDTLNGLYITAEDVNTTVPDLEVVHETTTHVTGLSKASGSSGNPSPYTARGCFLGIKACLERVFGKDGLKSRRIAILGVGSVGSALARMLRGEGAEVWAHDLKPDRVQALVEECGVHPAEEAEVLEMEADVFAPCALGGVLNDQTIPRLRCRIVAGAANNVLLEDRHGDDLMKRGLLYAPDYVINAGGIINVSVELLETGYDERVSFEKIRRIPKALHEVFDLAEERKVSTSRASDLLAERILEEARRKAG